MSTSRLDANQISASAAADYSASQYCCVALSAEGPPPTATLASVAGQEVHGILQDDPDAAGRACSVKLLGTSKAKAGAAISFMAPLTCDSSGRVVTRTSNTDCHVGYAMRAASAANDIIEVLLVGFVAKPVVLNDGIIMLPLSAARELASNEIPAIAANMGILCKDSTPNLEAANAGTDQQLQLEWAASNSDVICWDVAYPPDLDPASNITFHAMAKSGGATDTPTLTIGAFEGVGDTDFGGATGALSATLAEVTRTLAAANVGGPPNNLVVTLTPGAHTTDTVVIQGACWLEYTRK